MLCISWLQISITETASEVKCYRVTNTNTQFLTELQVMKAAPHRPKRINNVQCTSEEMSFKSVLNHVLRSSKLYRMRFFILTLFCLLNTHHIQHVTGNGTSGLRYWKSIVGNMSTGPEGQPTHVLCFLRMEQMDNCLMETIYTKHCVTPFYISIYPLSV